MISTARNRAICIKVRVFYISTGPNNILLLFLKNKFTNTNRENNYKKINYKLPGRIRYKNIMLQGYKRQVINTLQVPKYKR